MSVVFTPAELERIARLDRSAPDETTPPMCVVAEEQDGGGRARRVDLAALSAAARRAGYANAGQALVAALGRHASAEVLRGQRPPGALSREMVARLLGVDELTLWPTVTASSEAA